MGDYLGGKKDCDLGNLWMTNAQVLYYFYKGSFAVFSIHFIVMFITGDG